MAAGKITWDGTGTRKYETGVSHGVLYVGNGSGGYNDGVAWNGLTGVTESPDGAENSDFWADNIKYASLRSAETFGGTIEAYTYPPEFAACNGQAALVAGVMLGQQGRTPFGLVYRTEEGSDSTPANTTGANYKIHIVYNATCSPSEMAYETINDSPDAITMSWEFDTVPVPVTGAKPTSYIVVDAATLGSTKLKLLEDKLFGTDAGEGGSPAATAPTLPDPDALKLLLNT